MSERITLYIARHGKTLMNTLDKVQGWCDSPLTQEGIDVAQYLGRGLFNVPLRSAYCSDLRRTYRTVEVILKAKGQENVPITEMYGLREACFGSYESDYNSVMWGHVALYLHYTSAEDMYNSILAKKLSYGDVLDAIKKIEKMGLAESFAQVEARTQKALRKIAEKEIKQGDGSVLVVAHGMSILCMLYNMGGKEILESHLANASVCKVIYQNGEFTVESMGDLSYVEKGKLVSKE